MTVKQENKAISLLKQSIIDDVINKLKDLDLKEEQIEQIKDKLSIKKNKKNSNRKFPTIAEDKKCTAKCKNGKPCQVAMCDKTLKICWAHMKKEERIKYQSTKAKKNLKKV
nr:telomere-binding protein [Saccharomycopsis selenospora]